MEMCGREEAGLPEDFFLLLCDST